MRAVGIDFGTTNSAVAVAEGDDAPRLASFAAGDGGERTLAFRSILHFEPEDESERRMPRVRAGPAALERYLATAGEGRLVQSIKSFLASPLFEATEVFGAIYQLEDLIGALLAELRTAAEAELGPLGPRVVVGRPVRFAGEGTTDERLALSRLRSALTRAGFEEVVFEYEPVAAAYHYGLRLREPEVVMIGDFGGGTSDFSLVRVGPRARAERESGRARPVLGNAGVPVAGDVFDGRIVRALVAPALGLGAEYRSVFGRVLPVPRWIYGHLERWHHLSFLRTPRTLALLFDLQREALEPERLEALVHVVREDLGFPLHRAVERAKLALGRADTAELSFAHGPVKLAEPAARADFERWIGPELSAISTCVDGLLAKCGVARGDVDRVFLTGGSSLVPAVRALFEARFGEARIRGGDELVSVASGLALRARELAPR